MPVAKAQRDTKHVPSEDDLNKAIHVERLICADADENNNKFWNGYVLANGDFYCEYGRVSDKGGCAHDFYAFGDETTSKKRLDSKTKTKLNYSGKKKPYTRQVTAGAVKGGSGRASSGGIDKSSLKALASKEIKGDAETKKLVQFLAEANVHQITAHTQISYNVDTGLFTTPLGTLVTQDGIDDARGLLNQISPFVQANNWEDSAFKTLLSNYLRIVPQDVGRKRGWHQTFLSASDALIQQNDILDSLAASLMTAETDDKDDSKPKKDRSAVFNVSLDVVEDDKIFKHVVRKYNADKGGHRDVARYRVKKIWSVNISTVRAAFERDGRKVGGIMELWHGTKASNLLSIFKGGLVIPPTSSGHVTGRLYGNGVYFSDQSTKSLRYATGAWGRHGNMDRTFMFLASVAMGKSHTPSGYQSGSYRLPRGYDSCFAKGGRSGVQNNEMIVYRTSQADLSYLIEFKNS